MFLISIDPKKMPIAASQFEEPIIDREYFMNLHDRFRSPHLWINENGKWRLRHTVWEHASKDGLDLSTQRGHEWVGNPAKDG